MQRRVPGWQATSDADLSVTLLDLFAAAADELADYQDRVMNEAYLATARNRVSLARHARLVDYQVHQGNQAQHVARRPRAAEHDARQEHRRAHPDPDAAAGTTFLTSERALACVALNDVRLYTWGDTRPALAAGDTEADLEFPTVALATDAIAQLTSSDLAPPQLLIAEELIPPPAASPGAILTSARCCACAARSGSTTPSCRRR